MAITKLVSSSVEDLVNPFANELLHVRDEKSGNGGASVTGFQTRELNTIVTNEITGASLSSNQITLPAGTYYIDASAPGTLSQRHNAHLNNDTDGTIQVTGTPAYSIHTVNVQVRSWIKGRFTISAQKNFSITHYFFDAQISSGLGVSTNNSQPSIYTNVLIWRIA